MKAFTRVVVGIAGAACAVSATAIPMAQASASRPAAAAHFGAVTHHRAPAWRQTVLRGCAGRDTVRPRRYVLTCADANNVLVAVHWRSWGIRTAFGHGFDAINTCTPTCVRGHFRLHKVLVVAWGIRLLSPHHWFFTHLTIIYTAKHPPRHTARSVTIPITRRGPA